MINSLTANLSGFWSAIKWPLLYTTTGLIVLLVITSKLIDFEYRQDFQGDLVTARSAARAWAGLNCASPPAGQTGLLDVLQEIGWSDGVHEPEAWGIRLTTGPDGACTGAMVLYSGQLVDTSNSATKRLIRGECASRQGEGALGFPVRPTVITGSQGEYQLRWDAGVGSSC